MLTFFVRLKTNARCLCAPNPKLLVNHAVSLPSSTFALHSSLKSFFFNVYKF